MPAPSGDSPDCRAPEPSGHSIPADPGTSAGPSASAAPGTPAAPGTSADPGSPPGAAAESGTAGSGRTGGRRALRALRRLPGLPGLVRISRLADPSGFSAGPYGRRDPGGRGARATGTPGRIGPAEAGRCTPAEAVLLDVREQYEWDTGHAPHAVHLPLSVLARLPAGAPLPPAAEGRPLVVICRSGVRSRQAAALLAARGARAVDVTGGMRAWARAGLPVVDERGRGGSIA
jgi:rhodanese-related sulfurtransferase